MEKRRIGYDTSFLTFNGFRSPRNGEEKDKLRTLGLFQVSRSKKGKYVVSCRQEREKRAIGKLTLQGILPFQFRGKKKGLTASSFPSR